MGKLTNAEKYLEEYSKRLGIEKPRMITNKTDYKIFCLVKLNKKKMPRLKHNLGRAFIIQNTIWINLRKHRGNITLRYTIAHELIHLKYPNLPHGIRFNKLTMQVITNRTIR